MSKSNASGRITWLLDNSLWLAAIGLMTSSSGIDGAYLAKIMEPRLWPLGYVLNTVSDISGLIIVYAFGRLQQERKNSKKWKLSWVLLGAEIVTVWFSWFFSWRQLRIVLPGVEGPFAESVAMIAAAFIPLLLAFIGWAQALQAGRFEEAVREGKFDEREKATEGVGKEEFANQHNWGNQVASAPIRLDILRRDGGVCFYCGCDLTEKGAPPAHLDHFYPESLGGASGDPLNLVLSCRSCNSRKQDIPPAPDMIAKFQVHLVKTGNFTVQEKVWLLHRLNIFEQQKEIATALGASPSYVSTSLKQVPDEWSEALSMFYEQLTSAGQPPQKVQD